MRKFIVNGMSCSACSNKVEKTISALPNVKNCYVNLLTKSLTVEGSISDQEIEKAITQIGYSIESGKNKSSKSKDENKDISNTRNRLIASAVVLVFLMYISMGYNMLGFPLPVWLSGNYIAIGLAQLILSSIVLIVNKYFFISAFNSLKHKVLNMNTLVSLGSGVSFIFSICNLFFMTDAQLKGDISTVSYCFHNLYFESSAMILTLITVGKLLEAISKGKTTNALNDLIKLSPKTITLLNNNSETKIPVERAKVGDIFAIKPGESIPLDGIIIDGSSTVDESALTGESMPVEKNIGDKISAGTINQSGFLKCKALKISKDTMLAQIIDLIQESTATKAPIARIADKISSIFVPTVICVAIIVLIVWLIVGENIAFAIQRAVSVLVISCPCALGLATPTAIMIGSGLSAKHGILFKNAVALENVGQAKTVAFDKTGTITTGKPKVTDILPLAGLSYTELLQLAFDLESKSEHPLAKAICDYSIQQGLKPNNIKDFKASTGRGVSAVIGQDKIIAGNLGFILKSTDIQDGTIEKIQTLSKQGKTPLIFVKNNSLVGVIAVADVIKDDSIQAIEDLQQMGLNTVMLTGDNQNTARYIANKVGINKIYSDVLPIEKEKIIRDLKKNNKVLMVGDGINDAPSLVSADVGIAIGNSTDIAIDSADVVIIKNNLLDVYKAIKISKATIRNIRQNLFWAFFYNILAMPIATGVLIPFFGFQINPMIAAGAMSLSSICVILNALRLNLINFNKKRVDKKESVDIMNKKLLKIEGMMCEHCQARVKSVLENIDGVEKAEVSHENGEAILYCNKDIDDKIICEKITSQGYKIISIK